MLAALTILSSICTYMHACVSTCLSKTPFCSQCFRKSWRPRHLPESQPGWRVPWRKHPRRRMAPPAPRRLRQRAAAPELVPGRGRGHVKDRVAGTVPARATRRAHRRGVPIRGGRAQRLVRVRVQARVQARVTANVRARGHVHARVPTSARLVVAVVGAGRARGQARGHTRAAGRPRLHARAAGRPRARHGFPHQRRQRQRAATTLRLQR